MDSSGWKRVFLGNAMDVDIDASSRVLIAPELRAAAGLVRDVMLLGMGSHFELWDARAPRRARSRGDAVGDARVAEELQLLNAAMAALGSTHRPAARGGGCAGDDADGIYVDAHLRPRRPLAAMLERLASHGRLVAIDRDPEAVPSAAADGPRRRPALLDRARQLRQHAGDAGRPRHRAVDGVLLDLGVSRRRSTTRRAASLPLRRPAGHADGPDPRRERRRISGPRRRAPHCGGDTRLWGRTVCSTGCKGACCSARKRAPCSNHRRACPKSWLVRSRPARRARTLQRARFKLFGFSSTPSLRSSNRP